MNKLTLWNNPLEFIKYYFQMKTASIAACGSYFGIIIFPNGKTIFRNEKIIELINNCELRTIDEKNDEEQI